MDIKQVETMVAQQMRQHGLSDAGWRFRWDNSQRRAGVCKYHAKVIGLSKPLMSIWTEEAVMDTITHEVAHALVGAEHRHNHVWRAKHIELGGSGRALYQNSEDRPAAPATWIGRCPKAGHEHAAYRPRRAPVSCGICSKRWDDDNIIVWTKVDTPRAPKPRTTPRPAPTMAVAASDPEVHVCKGCGESKPTDAYGKSKGVRRPKCKACVNAAHKAWREGR
jgi:hypothetical protein